MSRTPYRLRTKYDAGVPDPDWAKDQRYPNSWTAEVAGVATPGSYTVTIEREDGAPVIPSTFVNSGEDNTTTADELRQALEANVLVDPFLETITDDDAGTVLAIGQSARGPTFHAPYRVTQVAPSPGTITIAPDDVFPLTVQVPSGVETARFSYVGLDTGGIALPNNVPSTRLDIDVIAVATGKPRHGVDERHVRRVTSLVGHDIADDHAVSSLAAGTEVTVRIGDVSNPNPSLDAIAVWVEWI